MDIKLYKNLWGLFTDLTKEESFPIEECVIPTTNERDPGVYYGENRYLILISFRESYGLKEATPYIWKAEDVDVNEYADIDSNEVLYGWKVDNHEFYDNFCKPIHSEFERVIGYMEKSSI